MVTAEYTSHRAELGKRIRRLRKEQRISTRKFSVMVGISKTYLLKLESGNANPTFDILERLAAGLDITPAQLIDFTAGHEEP